MSISKETNLHSYYPLLKAWLGLLVKKTQQRPTGIPLLFYEFSRKTNKGKIFSALDIDGKEKTIVKLLLQNRIKYALKIYLTDGSVY